MKRPENPLHAAPVKKGVPLPVVKKALEKLTLAEKQGIRDKAKLAFIDMYQKCGGMYFMACYKLQVHPNTVDRWRESDSLFERELKLVKEGITDSVEHPFIERARTQTAESIFYLKTQAKHRGYIERQEINMNANVQLSYSESDKALLAALVPEFDIKTIENKK